MSFNQVQRGKTANEFSSELKDQVKLTFSIFPTRPSLDLGSLFFRKGCHSVTFYTAFPLDSSALF